MKKEKNNILVISPHLDDIELSMYGELTKYKNDNVTILVLSSGLKNWTQKNKNRREIQIYNIKEINPNIKLIINDEEIDTIFWKKIDKIKEFLFSNTKEVLNKKNLITYGPCGDQHQDHRITEEICDVLFRPKFNISSYIKYFIPSGTTFNKKKPNYFVECSSVMKNKHEALKRYQKKGFLSGLNTPKNVKLFNKYWGKRNARNYCEVFYIEYIN